MFSSGTNYELKKKSMKKIPLLLGILWLTAMNANSQLTKEHTFSNQSSIDFQSIQLDKSGKKLMVINQQDSVSYELAFYNTDYSVFKEIQLDIDPLIIASNYSNVQLSIAYISENLFDTDNDIDLLCELSYNDEYNELYSQVIIFNADGSQIFASDIENSNAFLVFTSVTNSSLTSSMFVSDGPKLVLDVYYFQENMYKYEIFSLPGNAQALKYQELKSGETENSLKVYPNPARDNISLLYHFPKNNGDGFIKVYDNHGRLVKTISAPGGKGTIRMDISGYPSGQYIYKLGSRRGGPRTTKVHIAK